MCLYCVCACTVCLYCVPVYCVLVATVQLSPCTQTRMMTLQPDPNARYRSVLDALVRIAKTEQPRNLFRGMSVVATAAGPAHALYFSMYESIKSRISGKSPVVAQGVGPAGTHYSLFYAFMQHHVACMSMVYSEHFYSLSPLLSFPSLPFTPLLSTPSPPFSFLPQVLQLPVLVLHTTAS